MQHKLTWCEIPVKDIKRAMQFYSEVFQFDFKQEKMGDYEMAMIQATPDEISGMLICGDHYEPTLTGVVVYLNGGEDLSHAVERAEQLGSQILWPKTAIGDGSMGFFAQISDCEGNRIGLYSRQ